MFRMRQADFDLFVAAAARAGETFPDWVRSRLLMVAKIEAEEATGGEHVS